MATFPTRRIGRTDLFVPVLGIGTCPLGELFGEIPEDIAAATFEAGWQAGIRLYDTAPWYGRGQGEHRTGRALYRRPRGDYVLTTKVGRTLHAPRNRAGFSTAPWKGGLSFEIVHDYTYDGILRSYEDSLQRLGINKVDVLYIHDLDSGYFPDETDLLAKLKELETGGFRALEELKKAGEIAAFGAGINERGMIGCFLDRHPLDVFLIASRYTLLEQAIYADELLRAEAEGATFVIGGAFSSGILATGVTEGARYEYGAAPPAIVERVRRIEAIARDHGVALPAAALQFPLGYKAVSAVIYGPTNPGEVVENTAHFSARIPAGFWQELRHENLILPEIPLPE